MHSHVSTEYAPLRASSVMIIMRLTCVLQLFSPKHRSVVLQLAVLIIIHHRYRLRGSLVSIPSMPPLVSLFD